jgi:hypothetical protein
MNPVAGGTDPDPVNDAMTFYDRLASLLVAGERLALCTLLCMEGSGPRRAGAKMLLRENGDSVGTVGGGLLEARTIVWAEETLRSGRAICRPFALSLQQASDEGMTCGGQAEVLVEPLDGTSPLTRDFWGEILALLRRGGCGYLVTAIVEEGVGAAVERFLVSGGGCAAVSVAGRTLPTELLASAVSFPTLVVRGSVRYFWIPWRHRSRWLSSAAGTSRPASSRSAMASAFGPWWWTTGPISLPGIDSLTPMSCASSLVSIMPCRTSPSMRVTTSSSSPEATGAIRRSCARLCGVGQAISG